MCSECVSREPIETVDMHLADRALPEPPRGAHVQHGTEPAPDSFLSIFANVGIASLSTPSTASTASRTELPLRGTQAPQESKLKLKNSRGSLLASLISLASLVSLAHLLT